MSSNKTVGQWVGAIVGTVIGYFSGNPMLGYAIGVAIGGVVDPPKGPTLTGPRLEDLTTQVSTFGAPLARLRGTLAVRGNVIWLENNKLKETVKKKKSGGKGGGGGATMKTYSYFATFAVALTDAPPGGIFSIRRIWIGPDLVFNAGSSRIQTIINTFRAGGQVNMKELLSIAWGFAQPEVNFRFYNGTDSQQPDARIQAEMGVGLTPAWRGLSYIVFYDLPLAKYGNSLLGAQVKIELVADGARSPTELVYTQPQVGTNLLRAAPIYPRDLNRGVLAYYINRSDDNNWFDVYEHSVAGTARHLHRQQVGDFFRPPLRYVGPGMCVTANTGLTIVRIDAGQIQGFPSALTQTWEAEYDGTRFVMIRRDISFVSPTYRMDMLRNGILYSNQDRAVFSVTLGADGIYALTDGGVVYVYDLDDLEEIRSFQLEGVSYTAFEGDILQCHISYSGGLLWLTPVTDGDDNARLRAFDPFSGALAFDVNDVPTMDYTSSRGIVAIINDGLMIRHRAAGVAPAIEAYRVLGVESDRVPLDLVVRDELLRSEVIRPQDLNLLDLATDRVRGYAPAGIQQIRACLAPLQATWPFDLIMSGYQLKAVRRGKASVATIPIELLDARPYGEQPGVQLDQQREMDTQLPRQVLVRHLDPDREYDINEQRSSERQSALTNDIRAVELPLSMTATEAARAADVLYNVAWLQRTPATFRLPPIYLGLEPADVITINASYGQFELLITEINYTVDGRLECSTLPNAAATYTSIAEGVSGEVPEQEIPVAGAAETVLLDIPLIRNEDDEPGFAAAMAGNLPTWAGGMLFRSSDNEQTWTDVQAWDAPVTMGLGRAPLSANDGYVTDRTSALRIDMYWGELEAITEAQMMMGYNWIAYGADGRWELMRFADCALQSDGSYIISTLLRGLRGTEWATGLHQYGDRVVLLDDPDIVGIGADLSALGVVRKWRGVSAGAVLDDAPSFDFAYRGVNLRPLSVVKTAGSRITNNWVITWDRRTRLQGTLWKTGQPLPLGEASERYEIDILSGGNVVRTLTATDQTVTYTSAQQTTDFGGVQNAINVNIYMISATVGRGYPRAAAFSI